MRQKLDSFFPTESEELREVDKHFITLRVTNKTNISSAQLLHVGDKFVVLGRTSNEDGDVQVLCSFGTFLATNSAVHHYSKRIA